MQEVASAAESTSEPTDAETSRFERGRAIASDGLAYPYRLLRPVGTPPTDGWPLVVFLHGAGERGADNELQLRHFPERMATPAYSERYPAFVLAVQCPQGAMWAEVDWSDRTSVPTAAEPTPALHAVEIALRRVIAREDIDARRILLTGLSMGGYGSWDMAVRHPEWFAAVAPICGGGDERAAARLVRVPIWAVHGDADRAVPVERSRSMVEAVRAAGGAPRYTELPGVGHDSWTHAYGPDGVLDWMFGQVRDAPAADLYAGYPFAPGRAGAAARAPQHASNGLEELVAEDTPLLAGARIAFFGDSITWQHGYIGLIEHAIATSAATRDLRVAITNRGINGGGAVDLRDGSAGASRAGGRPGGDDNAAQAPFAALLEEDRPDVVVIFIGINDVNRKGTTEEAFAQALADLVREALRRRIAVVLATPWLSGERPDGTNGRDEAINRFGAIVRETAQSTGATFVDLRGAAMAYLQTANATIGEDGRLESRPHGLLTYDGIHPSAEGNDFLAQHLAGGLVRAMRTDR